MSKNRTEELQAHFLRRIPLDDGGFRYEWPDGRPYRDRRDLARIASLAIPPAYVDVYVSPDPDDELQAFGRDARGRLQYRYHPDFVHTNAARKWRRLARFVAALPRLREVVASDVRRAGLPRRKVLALLTRLLYRVYFRVGSTSYTRRYRSYGLTTLCKRHVRVEGNRVVFRYRGKRGVEQQQEVCDRCLAQALRRLLKLPGPTLFQYVDDEGVCHPLRSGDVNAYIREAMGPFSAKDFRTWGGTLLAAEFLAAAGPADSERAAAKIMTQCVRAVSQELGNTPAVTRASYICPVIFDRYLAARVLDDFAPDCEDQGLTRSEAALRRMLSQRGRSGRKPSTGNREGEQQPRADAISLASRPPTEPHAERPRPAGRPAASRPSDLPRRARHLSSERPLRPDDATRRSS